MAAENERKEKRDGKKRKTEKLQKPNPQPPIKNLPDADRGRDADLKVLRFASICRTRSSELGSVRIRWRRIRSLNGEAGVVVGGGGEGRSSRPQSGSNKVRSERPAEEASSNTGPRDGAGERGEDAAEGTGVDVTRWTSLWLTPGDEGARSMLRKERRDSR